LLTRLVAKKGRPISLHWFARIALVLWLALGASGCTRLLYDRLDTLAGWYLGSLVALDDAQRADLHTWLEQTLQWHRKSELARYAQFLRELAQSAAQPVNRAAFEQAEARIEAFGKDLVEQVSPEAARLLLTLSPAQVDELLASLEEKSQERSEDDREEIAEGTWHRKRATDLQRQLKKWTGSVTTAQKTLLEQSAGELEPTSGEWLDCQRRWRAALRDALEEPRTAASSDRVLALLRAPDSEWTAEYAAKSARNRERVLAMLEALDASLTPAQRERLQRELTRLAGQLEDLTED
jgi:Family of unknown function (DUF6279)